MSGPVNQLAKDRAANLRERQDGLEENLFKVMQGLNNLVEHTEDVFNKLAQASEVIEAIIAASGPEFSLKVQEKMRENRKKTEEALAKKALENVTKELEQKAIRELEAVTETSTLAVKQFSPTGDIVNGGYELVPVNTINSPELRAQFVGKQRGHLLDMPNGCKVEILGIYESNPDAPVKASEPTNA